MGEKHFAQARQNALPLCIIPRRFFYTPGKM